MKHDLAAIVKRIQEKLLANRPANTVSLAAPKAVEAARELEGKPSPTEAMRRTESTHLRTPLKGEQPGLAARVEEFRRRLEAGADAPELRRLADGLRREADGCGS